MSAFVVKILLVLAVLILVAAAVSRMRGRRSVGPVRQRMPMLVLFVGVLLVAMGGLMALASFTAQNADGMLWPLRVASVVIALGGAWFLVMYRNFYVEPRADEVAFRTVWGREGVIAYADITDFSVHASGGRLRLTVRAASGARLRLTPNLYDLSPLLRANEFRQHNGRWPVRGELYGGPGPR
ncbi:hypothetical protein [Microbacterium azadirachtae]|uniref:Uncharacterized protein n=1 Tax=Microbacterium azadirachtae TaxID=582680 RepID=A0A0F0KP17_9MICO|nr:hypothetical protein [Microbacterium azadirachtae]KJL21860.1 hypothetical protein RL72_02399 [Microbacterium azadirachtae]UXW86186.1 hypothetical protein NFX31_01180 [Microbacterium azadirachtae]SDL60969.1 hypothetical protein SAMN04488593_1309 [Microbacterium azadirachtae]SEF89849.1 hypothetical protein SAMN04488594_1296 [Microbacterium azadirachtae]SEF91757.1 hypothetical protein SAMN04488592_1306 [Microbacterium azadirachtae]